MSPPPRCILGGETGARRQSYAGTERWVTSPTILTTRVSRSYLSANIGLGPLCPSWPLVVFTSPILGLGVWRCRLGHNRDGLRAWGQRVVGDGVATRRGIDSGAAVLGQHQRGCHNNRDHSSSLPLASIPYAALSIVRSFVVCSPGTEWPVAWVSA